MALILVICQKIGQMGLTLATLTKSAFFGGGQCPARFLPPSLRSVVGFWCLDFLEKDSSSRFFLGPCPCKDNKEKSHREIQSKLHGFQGNFLHKINSSTGRISALTQPWLECQKNKPVLFQAKTTKRGGGGLDMLTVCAAWEDQ